MLIKEKDNQFKYVYKNENGEEVVFYQNIYNKIIKKQGIDVK